MRLVAKGTIEELKYCRQVYKVHQNQITLDNNNEYTKVQPARLFCGVANDKDRKGELFGTENLLKFKDGSFMDDLWRSSERNSKSNSYSHNVSDLVAALQGQEDKIENGFIDEVEEMEEVAASMSLEGVNHEDFLREDRGDVLSNDVIGYSQVHFEACESACKDLGDESPAHSAKIHISSTIQNKSSGNWMHSSKSPESMKKDSKQVIVEKSLNKKGKESAHESLSSRQQHLNDDISEPCVEMLTVKRKVKKGSSLLKNLSMHVDGHGYAYRSSAILYKPRYLVDKM